MFLMEPARTNYDLHFRVGPFPVRVHPLFWLITLLLGMGTFQNPNPPIMIALWLVVVFISILVHELGHALAMRRFGYGARVVLYSFGGLAIQDDNHSFESYRGARTTREQVIISLAGPIAGFLFAALVLLVVRLSGQAVTCPWLDALLEGRWPQTLIPFAFEPYGFVRQKVQVLDEFIYDLLYVNIFWGIVNLMPLFPLDGGQVARALFVEYRPYDGERQSLILSVGTGILLSVFGLLVLKSTFSALFFGALAFSSYQILRQMHGGGPREW